MIRDTGIQGLKLIEPKVYEDQRGYFMESYNDKAFKEAGLNHEWVQDNESFSTYGILRGLHFQKGDHAQAKLVRVTHGKVLDVVVDLRRNSPSFGKHFSIVLSADNKRQLLVPRGFAHGYCVLSQTALFMYKCDNFYAPNEEGGIHALDPELDIDWLVDAEDMLISEKDQANPSFADFQKE